MSVAMSAATSTALNVRSAIVKAVTEGVIAKPRNWRAFSSHLVGAQWIDGDDVLRVARTDGHWWKETLGAISIAEPIAAGADVLIHWTLQGNQQQPTKRGNP